MKSIFYAYPKSVKMAAVMTMLLLSGCLPFNHSSMEDSRHAKEIVGQGIIHLREGDLSRASAAFEVAIEIAPIAAAYDGMGCVEMMRGNYTSAERLLWKAYEIDEHYDHVLGNLALLYEAMNKVEKAGELYAWALQADPKNYRVRNNYAVYLAEREANTSARSGQIKQELLKAQALADHPVIKDNLKSIEEVLLWQEK